MSAEVPEKTKKIGGFAWFALIAFILFVLRIVLGLASAPLALANVLTILTTIIFMGAPILAMLKGTDHTWNWKSALVLLVVGAAFHVGSALVLRQTGQQGLGPVVISAAGQTGLLGWCLALGILVSLAIKDKNLLLPVALFLAGFDIFLVFNPVAPTAQIVQNNPGLFESVAMSIPRFRPAVEPGEAPRQFAIEPIAQVGPADLFCIATFFACLFRFRMRVKETIKWLIPVMIGYLILVLLPIGFGMLPALVPIGLTVLFVNWREFQMTSEEKKATWGVAVIALMLAGYGVYRRITYTPPAEQPEPSLSEGVPQPPKSATTPGPKPLGQFPL